MRSSYINYRRSLPFGGIFILASLASTVLFIIYAFRWNNVTPKLTIGTGPGKIIEETYNEYSRAKYSYYGAVVSLLMLIVFFNGYHLTKMT